jgi:hypothetical protein
VAIHSERHQQTKHTEERRDLAELHRSLLAGC